MTRVIYDLKRVVRTLKLTDGESAFPYLKQRTNTFEVFFRLPSIQQPTQFALKGDKFQSSTTVSDPPYKSPVLRGKNYLS